MIRRIITILTLAVFITTVPVNAGIIITTKQDIILPPHEANTDYLFVNRNIGEETVRPANWQEWYETNTQAEKKSEHVPMQMSRETKDMLTGLVVLGILVLLLRNYKPKNKCYRYRYRSYC